jgi:uncharacterized protein YfaP (DUF2135 family)
VPTPTATKASEPSTGLPDGALLALSPSSKATVNSGAVLIRGTVESGARVFINGEEMEPDSSGDFMAPVAIATGSNIIKIEITAADGSRVSRDLTITRES